MAHPLTNQFDARAELLRTSGVARQRAKAHLAHKMRLERQLAEAQRPDGTFGGASGRGWTAQRMIATTAEAVRVMQAAAAAPGTRAEQARRATLADRVRLRASAAVERA